MQLFVSRSKQQTMKPNQTGLFSQLFDVVCFWHGILKLGIALLHTFARCFKLAFFHVSTQMPQDGRLRLAVANAGDSRAVLGRKD